MLFINRKIIINQSIMDHFKGNLAFRTESSQMLDFALADLVPMFEERIDEEGQIVEDVEINRPSQTLIDVDKSDVDKSDGESNGSNHNGPQKSNLSKPKKAKPQNSGNTKLSFKLRGRPRFALCKEYDSGSRSWSYVVRERTGKSEWDKSSNWPRSGLIKGI
jgi:hypothetical protein